MAKSTTKKKVGSDDAKASESKWVSSMHAHFHENGTYRLQDVHRVLGDPGKQVGSATSTGPWMAQHKKA